MRATILTLVWASVCGCAAQAPQPTPPPPNPADVRMAAQTPYDGDAAMRAVYLNYYWLGYHDGMRGITGSFCDNSHPWYKVQRDGLSAGHHDGIAAFFASKKPN